jgi:hypothetical protein
MPRIKTLTLAMSAVFMMAGCASTQTSVAENGLKMAPVQAVTHGQGNPQALYQLGRYYQGQARYDLALRAYREALALQPRYVDALTGMGVVYANLGQYDTSLQLLVAAASLDPASVSARNNLGYVHWLRDEGDEAIHAYRQALKLDPMNASARANLRKVMKDAANDPPATSAQGATGAETGAGTLATPLRQLAPQVYELRAPAPGGAMGIAPAAVSGVALNEVAPRIYELRKPVETAKAAAPIPATRAVAEKAPEQPAVADGAVPARLVVMNGNGVNGIADTVSRYLAEQGYPSAGIGNHAHFNEARTRIEYRPGHAEQARHLASLLPRQAVLSEVAAGSGQADIRLVLGKDIRQQPDAWNTAVHAGSAAAATEALRLDVANGNGVKGMARKVAGYLSGRGYRATGVYDLRPFDKAATRIEYRKGYESQAIKLGDQLPGKVAYVESDALRSNVRLVLGHDIKNNLVVWSPWLEWVKLAEAESVPRL